jgi:hypothetical protein
VLLETRPALALLLSLLHGQSQMNCCSSQVGSLLVRHFRASVARGLALSARKWASHTAAAEAGRLAPVVESLATRCCTTVFAALRLTSL